MRYSVANKILKQRIQNSQATDGDICPLKHHMNIIYSLRLRFKLLQDVYTFMEETKDVYDLPQFP